MADVRVGRGPRRGGLARVGFIVGGSEPFPFDGFPDRRLRSALRRHEDIADGRIRVRALGRRDHLGRKRLGGVDKVGHTLTLLRIRHRHGFTAAITGRDLRRDLVHGGIEWDAQLGVCVWVGTLDRHLQFPHSADIDRRTR